MKQTVSYLMGDGHNVTGDIPVSYDNFVFKDIEENIVFKKSSIEKHYQKVTSTLGAFYKGFNKNEYGNILQAFRTIINAKKNRLRGSGKCKAIAFLHQEMKFSLATIQKILLLFCVKMTSGKILEESAKVFSEKITPAWIQKFLGGML